MAAELIKGLKQLPELQFKVQGYIEGCTRDAIAPRGRAILHMISRHFDLDRHRGALLTSQSVFQIDLSGFTVRDLQESAGQIDWPSKRILGEFLFHKVRTVRRLERVIDETKRSPENFSMRDFDYLWGRLQKFLTEEREDVNAGAIELSLKAQRSQCPRKLENRPCLRKPRQQHHPLLLLQLELRPCRKLLQRKLEQSFHRKENQRGQESP